ncbi:hypothetical protein GCM10028820_21060 [Tessaracoccus terricola]
MAALGLLLLWISPPGLARALEVEIDTDGFAVIEVPAVPGAVGLWLDVEAPGLVAADVVALLDGVPVPLRDTPLGAGAVVEHDGAAATLAVRVGIAAEPDIAITLVDAADRILLADSARVEFPTGADGEPPATPEPTPTPPSPDPTQSTPDGGQTAAPTRPGLPSSGGDL